MYESTGWLVGNLSSEEIPVKTQQAKQLTE